MSKKRSQGPTGEAKGWDFGLRARIPYNFREALNALIGISADL